jgi:hypothetical protein
MVKIELDTPDPILVAADLEMERREAAKPRRLHLGMSGGGQCPRFQWFSWLWAHDGAIPARGLRAIDDGNRGEDVVAARIQAAPDTTLLTLDPDTGRQFEVVDAGGHVRGHMDGVIYSHPKAPKTPHVWECKVVNEKKLAAFRKIKKSDGEKETLRNWDFVYWVQAQLYMLYGGYKRHWLTVASAGVRDWDACRTVFKHDEAEYFAERMRSMVENIDELPERVSDNPAAFACKWCDAKAVCHEAAPVARNCRTCRFSAPVDGPQWLCTKHDFFLSADEQIAGCSDYTVREVMSL